MTNDKGKFINPTVENRHELRSQPLSRRTQSLVDEKRFNEWQSISARVKSSPSLRDWK